MDMSYLPLGKDGCEDCRNLECYCDDCTKKILNAVNVESRPTPLALDGAIAPDNQQVLPADVLVGEGTLPEPPRQ